jgi:hypothetical protein
MSDDTFTIRTYYSRTIHIDDGEGRDFELPVRIRRFSIDQLKAFSAGYRRCENRASDRFISRKPDGDEQEKHEITIGKMTVSVPTIPDAEIRRRRLIEMPDAERDRYEALEAEDERYIADFSAQAIREHVWVKPGVRLALEASDGQVRELRTGEDLAEGFAGNLSILTALMNAVREENTLSAEEKKRLRSLSALTRSSSAATPTPDGVAPVATAESVAPMATAPIADATDLSAMSLSGSTAT